MQNCCRPNGITISCLLWLMSKATFLVSVLTDRLFFSLNNFNMYVNSSLRVDAIVKVISYFFLSCGKYYEILFLQW